MSIRPPARFPTLLAHVAWALAAGVAFCAGYFAAPSGSPAASIAAAKVARGSGAGDSKDATRDQGTFSAAETSALPALLSPEQAKVRAFQCLSIPDRVERMKQLCELIPSITKDNWRGVMEAMQRQAASEYRMPTADWNFLLERVGAVAGAEGIEEALGETNRNLKGRARLLIGGWAEGDPTKAAEWFAGQSPAVRLQLVEAFSEGLSRTDGKQALEVLRSFPKENVEFYVGAVVSNAIQRGGFRNAEQVFGEILTKASSETSLSGNVFLALAERRLAVDRLEGRPLEALDWFDGYLRPDSPAGPGATGNIIGAAAEKDPVQTAKWLDERDERLQPDQRAAAYTVVARSFASAAPDDFIPWLEQHQDHPLYDNMVQATLGTLYRKGKTAEAAQLAGSVQDEGLRAQLQQQLAKMTANPKAPAEE